MHHLVYTSTANFPLTQEELDRLLPHWREKNARLGVTGMLLYSEGDIMQVLEGDAEVLHTLFAAIAADVRHRGVTKLADGPVEGRVFAEWSMRFRTVDAAYIARLAQQATPAPGQARDLAPVLAAYVNQEPWV